MINFPTVWGDHKTPFRSFVPYWNGELAGLQLGTALHLHLLGEAADGADVLVLDVWLGVDVGPRGGHDGINFLLLNLLFG